MKDNDFRGLVDREFASLTWTDQQRMNTLRQMNKEVRPIMKRKAAFAAALVLAVVVMSAAALAVTMNIPTIQDFFDQNDDMKRLSDYQPFCVDDASVIQPTNQRHTSSLVDVSIQEAYLTTEALYLTVHLTPKDEGTLLFTTGLNSVVIDGTELRYYNLFDREELSLQMFGSMVVQSPYFTDDWTLKWAYAEAQRSPEDDSITLLIAFSLPEDSSFFCSGGTLMGRFILRDCRNDGCEFNTIYFDVPPMTAVEAYDAQIVH